MDDYKSKLSEIIAYIDNLEQVPLNSIPDIELYMDQVTTFIDNKFKNYKRNESDKLLTKTMINNYTKCKLLPPSNKKKYSKNHMILLILIYHLKSIISINDIYILFKALNINSNTEADFIEDIYLKFIEFQKSSPSQLNLENTDLDKTDLGLFVINLIVQAEKQKLLAERIIDTFFEKRK